MKAGTATRRRVDPARLARRVRALTLPMALVMGFWFYRSFGILRVPAGMDSMPGTPPGSVCIIDKRPSTAAVGHVVFVRAPGGGIVLSRVQSQTPAGSFVVLHDNPESALPDSRSFGPASPDAIVGVVLVLFPGPGIDGEAIDGR